MRSKAPLLLLVPLAFVAVLLGGGLLTVIGSGPGDDPEPGSDAAPPSTSRPPADPTTPVTAPPEGQGPTVSLVVADPEPGEFPPAPRAVGDLDDSTVLSLRVAGFPSFSAARAEQCTTGTPVSCRNAIDVQFREDGTASFQYLVHRDFAASGGPGACGLDAPPCTVVVLDPHGDARTELRTLFGDPLPTTGRVEVTPSTGLVSGDVVRVTAAGQVPAAELDVQISAAPDVAGRQRCGAPAPVAHTTVGSDGTATAQLTITDGPIGRDEIFCRREQRSAVVVSSRTAFSAAGAVEVGFAAPAGADYDPMRLAVGLGAALVLLVIATVLIRGTDWSPVGEVAAPEIDDAEYADLDAIIAALPPEEDDEAEELARH